MPAEAPDLPFLIERFKKLHAADRKAVRAHLSPSERDAVNQACLTDGHSPEDTGTTHANRRLAGYSPWLARTVAGAIAGKDGEPALPPATRAALVAAHESTLEEGPGENPMAKFLRQLGLIGAEHGRGDRQP